MSTNSRIPNIESANSQFFVNIIKSTRIPKITDNSHIFVNIIETKCIEKNIALILFVWWSIHGLNVRANLPFIWSINLWNYKSIHFIHLHIIGWLWYSNMKKFSTFSIENLTNHKLSNIESKARNQDHREKNWKGNIIGSWKIWRDQGLDSGDHPERKKERYINVF